MKKAICLVLALIMCCSVFLVACSGNTETATQGGGPGVTLPQGGEDESAIYDAEVKNLNGKEFHIIARTTGTAKHLDSFDIYAETKNGEKINDAVFARNSAIEQEYNCKITFDQVSNVNTEYRDALIAGDYVADLFFDDIAALYNLAKSCLLEDFRALDNIDLTKKWWSQQCNENLSLAGKTFYVTGDVTTMDERATWVMYFNPEIVASHSLESPYALVDRGEWTIDKMYEYITTCTQDMNGNGEIEWKKDVIGYLGEEYNNWVHVAACNVTVSQKEADGSYTIPLTPKPEILTAWEAVRKVVAFPHRWVSSSGSVFKMNLVAFYGVNIGGIFNFQNSEVSLGFLPFPKMNVEQDGYYTAPSNSQYSCYCIPINTDMKEGDELWKTNGFSSSAEQVAYFLEAFAYYSTFTLTPAYYDQVLMKQLVRDEESIRMLEIALDMDHIILDPVALFSFGMIGHNLFRDCGPEQGSFATDTNYDTLVSVYGERVTKAQTALAQYIELIDATV